MKEQGFCIVENVYAESEVRDIIDKIRQTDISSPAFRRTDDLFAIRRFLQEVVGMEALIFTPALRSIIDTFGPGYFPVRSIYFVVDKEGKPEDYDVFIQAWNALLMRFENTIK